MLGGTDDLCDNCRSALLDGPPNLEAAVWKRGHRTLGGLFRLMFQSRRHSSGCGPADIPLESLAQSTCAVRASCGFDRRGARGARDDGYVSLERLLASGRQADVRIFYRETDMPGRHDAYLLHRGVVVPRCPRLGQIGQQAADGGGTLLINLVGFGEETIRAVVHFLYLDEYATAARVRTPKAVTSGRPVPGQGPVIGMLRGAGCFRPALDSLSAEQANVVRHMRVFRLADVLGLNRLAELALEGLGSALSANRLAFDQAVGVFTLAIESLYSSSSASGGGGGGSSPGTAAAAAAAGRVQKVLLERLAAQPWIAESGRVLDEVERRPALARHLVAAMTRRQRPACLGPGEESSTEWEGVGVETENEAVPTMCTEEE